MLSLLIRIPVLLLLLYTTNTFSQVMIIPYGSSWKYLDNGSNQGTAWRVGSFDDNSWLSGNAELGYGDGDETTVVGFGSNASNKHITTYFRKTITIPDPSSFTNFTLNVKYDDGMIVYVNGNEIARAKMTNPISYTKLADAPSIEDQVSTFTIPTSSFATGR